MIWCSPAGDVAAFQGRASRQKPALPAAGPGKDRKTMTTCRKSASLKTSNNNHLFYLLQVIHEYRHPSVDVRACWQPPALRSSHAFGHWLPATFLLVFIMPWLLSGCGGSGSSAAMPIARRRIASPTPPGRNGPSSAARPSSMAGRSTAMSTAAASASAASHSASKIGDYWGSCGHPNWNGRNSSRPWSGAFVAWTMSPFRHQRRRLPARRPPRRLSRGAL